ncbi:MAG: phage major tail protein, TP901-1 family [Carnobacterium sp.]|uniref:phage tail tube protein n=1 Tax=Carnobacterium sp. TaxID=48221 RepID=UPI003C7281B6
MATIKGVDVLIEMNTGTAEVPVYTKIAGQRGASLSREKETTETTTKDSNGWQEFEAGFKSWSISTDGLLVVDDVAYGKLEDSYLSDEKLLVHVLMPSGVKYEGTAICNSLENDLPYDDEVSYSCEFQGSGELKKSGGA